MAWLDTMTSLGLGGCLADDMGLGKTITVIALYLHRQPAEPVLVVCPASSSATGSARSSASPPVRPYAASTAPAAASTAWRAASC